jgi:quinolinate synthase
MITADALFEKLSHVTLGGTICRYSKDTCATLAPQINAINALKAQKNAIILAHSYVAPEIVYGVADHVGDSFELSKIAQSTSSDIIIFAAVKFMAETAKVLNPTKRVFIPSQINGCSLADSITVEGVQILRHTYPDHAFICYINTSAAVKAHCDCTVTSSNVYTIVEKYPNDRIYFLPDRLMGQNIANHLQSIGSTKIFDYYTGTCYVHEEYDPDMIAYIRSKHPQAAIVAHPECQPAIVDQATFVGSTSQMIQYVKTTTHDQYVLLTECGLTARLQAEEPQKQFIGSCTMCRYMKSNTLDHIQQCLESPHPSSEIHLDDATIQGANQSLAAMFRYAS